MSRHIPGAVPALIHSRTMDGRTPLHLAVSSIAIKVSHLSFSANTVQTYTWDALGYTPIDFGKVNQASSSSEHIYV